MLVDVDEARAVEDALEELNGFDLAALGDGAVHRTLVGLHELSARLAAITAVFAAEWDHRKIWEEDGSKSAAARLAREVNSSKAAAKRTMQLARTLEKMPLAAAALAAGRINLDHIDLLRIAAARKRGPVFTAHEQELVGWCRDLSYHDAGVAITYWCQKADAKVDDQDGDEPLVRDREASWGRGVGQEHTVRATLDPVGGAIVTSELDRLEKQLWEADQRDADSTRTDAQRRADALVEMANRSGAMPESAKKPRILVTVAVGDDSFRHLCELCTGAIVKAEHLVPYVGMVDINSIIFDGPFHAIAASPSRNFTGALRRAIEIRDRHCQHPAGDYDPINRCDVDHVIPKAEGGITCQCNADLMGRRRNRDQRAHRRTLADVTINLDDPLYLAAKLRVQQLVDDRRRRDPPPEFDP